MPALSSENRLLDALKVSRMTLAVAEGCTGGTLAKRLSDVPSAQGIMVGSLVTRSAQLRIRLLELSRETVRTHGLASAPCAEEMAIGIRKIMHADIGLSTTGHDAKNPAVYVGIATPLRSFSFKFTPDPDATEEQIKDLAASKAFLRLYREITGDTK